MGSSKTPGNNGQLEALNCGGKSTDLRAGGVDGFICSRAVKYLVVTAQHCENHKTGPAYATRLHFP